MTTNDKDQLIRELEGLDGNALLEKLLERDPSFAEGSAIYHLVNSLCASLKDMRAAAGLTQTQLAEKLGVSQGRISQIESGLPDHAPSLEMVARFVHACGFYSVVRFEPGILGLFKGTPKMPGLEIAMAPATPSITPAGVKDVGGS